MPTTVDGILQQQLKIGKYRMFGGLRSWMENMIAELDRNAKLERQ